MQFVDGEGQSEDDSERYDGSQQSEEKDVEEVFAEIFFLEVVASCEDHRGQQAVEEDFL